ncbi:hypothetical protein GCK32_021782 [Trichostrongylus colubriformis]|uniref:Uncharacterized protein n=1 Tax=Trichostrongylus colubriformis TaxID=6319 RepID=A0AAN8IJ80_TRICO
MKLILLLTLLILAVVANRKSFGEYSAGERMFKSFKKAIGVTDKPKKSKFQRYHREDDRMEDKTELRIRDLLW